MLPRIRRMHVHTALHAQAPKHTNVPFHNGQTPQPVTTSVLQVVSRFVTLATKGVVAIPEGNTLILIMQSYRKKQLIVTSQQTSESPRKCKCKYQVTEFYASTPGSTRGKHDRCTSTAAR